MTVQDLARSLAEDLGVPQTRAREIVQKVCDGITEALVKEGRIQLGHFGTFLVKTRKARHGRNPRTGEKLVIPPKVVATFRPGPDLRERVGRLSATPQ
jgi:nucleoid DNA-binding protein